MPLKRGSSQKTTEMSDWQIAKEVCLSILKWFVLVVVLNNLIWGLVMYCLISGPSAEIRQTQDGQNNVQELVNG